MKKCSITTRTEKNTEQSVMWQSYYIFENGLLNILTCEKEGSNK